MANERKPRAVLLLDYPGFNLRLAKDLKKKGHKIIYYISPQVWAWHKSRIHEIRKYIDKMLVILPFEADFYRDHNVQVEFVGHPLLDEINPSLFDEGEHRRGREKFGVRTDDFCVGLMPGSRVSEMTRHLEVQIATAELLHAKNPLLKFMLLVAPTFSIEEVKKMLPPTSLPLILCKNDPMQMVSLVDAVLCASGTATLVVGLMKKPMIVMYKTNPLTAFLARNFVGTEHFGLINLILNGRVVQEFFQNEANPTAMAAELQQIIDDKSYYRDMQNKLASSHDLLGRRGATERVARALDEFLAP
jgi:lipid-A-disaccharide synthase